MVSIRALEPSDNRASFRSGNEDLDRFFRKYAALNQFSHHVGTTYVAVEGKSIAGFATVAPATIQADEFPATRARGLPSYPLPTLRLARLAVDRAHQRRGIGSMLLRYVFTLALEMAARLGCAGVLVDAKPGAIPYYAGFGFEAAEPIEGQPLGRPEPVPMFLALDKVRAALGG